MGDRKRYAASTPGQSEILAREAEVIASEVTPARAVGSELYGPLVEEIAREMQVPLSNMLLGAQTLEKLLAAAEIKGNVSGLERVFKIFQRSCQQQRHLVETLLELAQTNEERVLATEPIALATWLPAVLATERDRARLWRQEIQLSVEPTLPPLATNGAILARVLTELFAEVSCQAPLGRVISLTVRATDDAICFDWDGTTAVSADPPDLEALQCLQDRERPQRNGAGLSLARKLAHLLGGAIDTLGEGEAASYRIKLPKPLQV